MSFNASLIISLHTVAVGIVEEAGSVEVTHAHSRVHLILAKNALLVKVAELVLLDPVLLISTT